jgi:CheY-like chemotaxis protein
MENILPVYQYPTLTVLVDDSQSFLDSLVFQLAPQLGCKAFYDAGSALDWVRHAYRQQPDGEGNGLIRVGYDEDGDSLERRNVSIYLDRIYRIVMDRARFTLPSVLVVDYAMPQMNGVEFCWAVRDLPCKKILLTGQADEKIAIDAFNRKLIDCFIQKNDMSAFDRLDAEIIRLQRELFNEQTHTLKDLLTRHTYTFLSDPAIKATVDQLSLRYRFVEHYLFPHPPGILFFDNQGKATLMVIETEGGLTAQLEIAEDQGAPPQFLNALRERKLIPYFSDTGGMYLKEIGENWLSYCLPPQICQGRETYYWALFDLPTRYLQGSVYSYAEFSRDQAGGLQQYAGR